MSLSSRKVAFNALHITSDNYVTEEGKASVYKGEELTFQSYTNGDLQRVAVALKKQGFFGSERRFRGQTTEARALQDIWKGFQIHYFAHTLPEIENAVGKAIMLPEQFRIFLVNVISQTRSAAIEALWTANIGETGEEASAIDKDGIALLAQESMHASAADALESKLLSRNPRSRPEMYLLLEEALQTSQQLRQVAGGIIETTDPHNFDVATFEIGVINKLKYLINQPPLEKYLDTFGNIAGIVATLHFHAQSILQQIEAGKPLNIIKVPKEALYMG